MALRRELVSAAAEKKLICNTLPFEEKLLNIFSTKNESLTRPEFVKTLWNQFKLKKENSKEFKNQLLKIIKCVNSIPKENIDEIFGLIQYSKENYQEFITLWNKLITKINNTLASAWAKQLTKYKKNDSQVFIDHIIMPNCYEMQIELIKSKKLGNFPQYGIDDYVKLALEILGVKPIIEVAEKIKSESKITPDDITSFKILTKYYLKDNVKYFKEWHRIQNESKNSDKHIPPIKIMTEKHLIQKLEKNDIRQAVLGEITGTCQSIGSSGKKYVEQGIVSDQTGVIILTGADTAEEKEPNKRIKHIIAGGLVWISKDNKNLVFDSLEIQPQKKPQIKDIIKSLVTFALQYSNRNSLDSITVGVSSEAGPLLCGLLPALDQAIGSRIVAADNVINIECYPDRMKLILHNRKLPLYSQLILNPSSITEIRDANELKNYDLNELFKIIIAFGNMDHFEYYCNLINIYFPRINVIENIVLYTKEPEIYKYLNSLLKVNPALFKNSKAQDISLFNTLSDCEYFLKHLDPAIRRSMIGIEILLNDNLTTNSFKYILDQLDPKEIIMNASQILLQLSKSLNTDKFDILVNHLKKYFCYEDILLEHGLSKVMMTSSLSVFKKLIQDKEIAYKVKVRLLETSALSLITDFDKIEFLLNTLIHNEEKNNELIKKLLLKKMDTPLCKQYNAIMLLLTHNYNVTRIIHLVSRIMTKDELKHALNDFVKTKLNNEINACETENILTLYKLIHGEDKAGVLSNAIKELEVHIYLEQKKQHTSAKSWLTFWNRSNLNPKIDKIKIARLFIGSLISEKLIGIDLDTLSKAGFLEIYNKYLVLLPAYDQKPNTTPLIAAMGSKKVPERLGYSLNQR